MEFEEHLCPIFLTLSLALATRVKIVQWKQIQISTYIKAVFLGLAVIMKISKSINSSQWVLS